MSEQSAPPTSLSSQAESTPAAATAESRKTGESAVSSNDQQQSRREQQQQQQHELQPRGGEQHQQRQQGARRHHNHQSSLSSSRSSSSNQSRRQSEGRSDSNLRADSSIGAAINMNELREVVELIAQHGFTDFELEREGFRVRLRRGNEPTAAHSALPQSTASSAAVTPSAAAPLQSLVAPPATTPPHASAETAVAAAATTAQPNADADLHIITSPIVGTFYRSPSPTSDSFVKQGSQITPDTVVCIVEAMKLMNEIPAEVSGTIEKIYVENAQPVEYGQPLFGVRK